MPDAPIAAITQVKNTLKAMLTVNGGPNIFTDRDGAEPVDSSERPAKVIRCSDVQLDEAPEKGRGCQLHIATIDIDHYEDTEAVDDLDGRLAQSQVETVALIGADEHLGQKVFELIFVSSTASADDVPDAGVAILTLQVKFLTKLFDWNTIIF